MATLRYTENLTGKTYTRLTVLDYHGRGNGSLWKCRCSCGEITIKNASALRNGSVKSCGCLKSDGKPNSPKRLYPSEYSIWVMIKQRCLNPNNKDYERYGGQGITICGRWKLDFNLFLLDMGLRPSKKHSIERKDNSKGYNPTNCIWATQKEQMRNTRANRKLTYNGVTLCVTEWADKTGIPKQLIYDRLHWGWSPKRIFTTPLNSHFRLLTCKGKTQNVADWAKEVGIPRGVIKDRLRLGWDDEKAILTPIRKINRAKAPPQRKG